MPTTLTLTADDDGRTVLVDIGATVRVELGPTWRAPRLRPLGGEPGPVTTPLQAGSTAVHLEPDLGVVAHFRAVSAGRTAIRAVPLESGGGDDRFEVTVVVRPKPGTKVPRRAR